MSNDRMMFDFGIVRVVAHSAITVRAVPRPFNVFNFHGEWQWSSIFPPYRYAPGLLGRLAAEAAGYA